MVQFINAREAVDLIQDGSVIATDGFVGVGVPEEILETLENKFLEEGHPRDLSLYFAAGQGDSATRALNHLGNEGCVSKVVGGHWNLCPRLQELALNDKIKAYNFPQGVVSHIFRAASQGLPFFITKVGLKTFCDPRLDGCRINKVSEEDLVHVMEIDGEEYLRYDVPKIDVAIVRATYADTDGNLSITKEALSLDKFSMCAAARANGGIVIAQVEDITEAGTLDPHKIAVPSVCVDYVVKTSDIGKYHMQTFGTDYNPAFSGQIMAVLADTPPAKLNNRKVCARRAAEFFKAGDVANLGIGMPETVAMVLNEEGQADKVKMSVEPGITGGVPMGGLDFGASINPQAIIDQVYQFDFYDGGGLDVAVLGLAECDQYGNVNVSKFGGRVAGCGGFINITQNVGTCIFVGTFTARGLRQTIGDGKIVIDKEGSSIKFLEDVEQITFSAEYARENGQKIYYITERAVFTLGEKGLRLIEIAPGIDLEKDVLAYMEFKPEIAEDLKTMDAKLFTDEKMGLVL